MGMSQEQLTLSSHRHGTLNLSQVPKYQSNMSDLLNPPFSPRYHNDRTIAICSQSQMTPPATPYCSQEDLHQVSGKTKLAFHSYLRAFCSFKPNNTPSDTTVTLPLRDGDIILIHSIHENGWADGTILTTGARGWLPTNYCNSYYPEPMQNLLDGLIKFCELLQNFTLSNHESIPNHEFMRGMISGVRFLLEQTLCLKKESALIRDCEILRRTRKSMLCDLSSLVKNAKSLYQLVEMSYATDPVYNSIESFVDSMTLEAFKVTTRGVHFLDLWKGKVNRRPFEMSLQLPNFISSMSNEDNRNPPSPPADISHYESFHNTEAPSYTETNKEKALDLRTSQGNHIIPQIQGNNTLLHRTTTIPRSLGARRPSSSRPLLQSHWQQELSIVPESSASKNKASLVSEKLTSSHDTLLSFLGSFIGKLHLHTQSSSDLIHVVQQFVIVGRELLLTVEMICDRDPESAHALFNSKNIVESKFKHLIVDAQAIIQSSGEDEESIVLPDQKACLLSASSACVRAAGECVAKTTLFLDQIGDFTYSSSNKNLSRIPELGLKNSRDTFDFINSDYFEGQPSIEPNTSTSSNGKFHRKPLPLVPPFISTPAHKYPSISPLNSPTLSEVNSFYDLQFIATLKCEADTSDVIASAESSHITNDISTCESNSTECETNSINEISTDEANEERSQSNKNRKSSIDSQSSFEEIEPSIHSSEDMKSHDSDIEISDRFDNISEEDTTQVTPEVEKTFVNELLFNKEGVFIGGTIKALVEKLTIHNSTPDSLFVSTFYLTFRLFVTPENLAAALIDRFNIVSPDAKVANHVQLRVYNVFKGWLESHWRENVDHNALPLIVSFATDKLEMTLPGAGKRLKDLTAKVSSSQRPLVPRTKSLILKTSTSLSNYATSDAQPPPPVLNRSSSMILRNWKVGSANPSILDFDPLEFARQLTIKGMNIFCSILPEELLDSQWTKRSAPSAANVRAMAALSTDLSTLVTETVLQHDDVKKRAIVVKHWIKIAQKCLELNNYDSLMAIICAMNSSSISRLKKTWDAVSQKRKDILKNLQTIVEPEKNYAILRRRLNDHVPPCLPFVGLFLTDLTFVDAGNPSTRHLPGKDNKEGVQVINFDKHMRTARIIFDLQRFQFNYRLTELPELQDWLQTEIDRFRSFNESELVQKFYRKSLILEPREIQTSIRNASDGTINSSSKEKFDIFGWATRERSSSINSPSASFP